VLRIEADEQGWPTGRVKVRAAAASAPAELNVGRRVRVRAGVEPAAGWGSVRRGSVGVLARVGGGIGGNSCAVDFPEQRGWCGAMRGCGRGCSCR
jgi:hypothetical protein